MLNTDHHQIQAPASRPALYIPQTAKSPLPCLSAKPGGEESDTYPGIITALNSKWRVIICRGGIQWVLQRQAGQRDGRPRWEGHWFCQTSEALIRGARERAGQIGGDALAIMLRLPERIGRQP
jgi:hypothetical protein